MGFEAGWQRYLFVIPEAVWGTPVTPDIYVPYDDYTVHPEPILYSPAMYGGNQFRRAPIVPAGHFLRGNLTLDMPAYQVTSGAVLKSVAQHLIDMARSGTLEPTSFTAIYADANDPVEHSGMRIGSMTISGTEGAPVKLAFTLEGKLETAGATPPTLTATNAAFRAHFPFLMQHCTFALAGSAVNLASFTYTENYNLQVKHMNSQWPISITKGTVSNSWQFQLFKTANTYDALRRALTATNITGQLVLKGRHEGTGAGTFTSLTIDIDRMQMEGMAEQLDNNALTLVQPTYMLQKPDTADPVASFTWGTSA